MQRNKVPAAAVATTGDAYQLRRRLGSGAFADVYLATHRLTGRASFVSF
jgi:serine/threonine protein kinase